MPQEAPTGSIQVNARLPMELGRALWAAAYKLDLTPSAYARKAIEEKLARDSRPAKLARK